MDNKATLNIPIYKDLSLILQNSEALILDVWGVLWDGIKVYPEAVPTLKEVKKLNIPCIENVKLCREHLNKGNIP